MARFLLLDNYLLVELTGEKAIKVKKTMTKNCSMFFAIYYNIVFISLGGITSIKILSKK